MGARGHFSMWSYDETTHGSGVNSFHIFSNLRIFSKYDVFLASIISYDKILSNYVPKNVAN